VPFYSPWLDLRTADDRPCGLPGISGLLAAWKAAPAHAWGFSPKLPITGFNHITCWHGLVVANLLANANEMVVFSERGRLHILSTAEVPALQRRGLLIEQRPSRLEELRRGTSDLQITSDPARGSEVVTEMSFRLAAATFSEQIAANASVTWQATRLRKLPAIATCTSSWLRKPGQN
jgi:hypothetical protein